MSLSDLFPDALPQPPRPPSTRANLLVDLAPGQSLSDAVGLLPSARTKQLQGRMICVGSKRRCAEKCKVMRERKRARKLERDNVALRRESKPLSEACNSERVRYGDRVACDVSGVHPHQVPIASVLRDAW